jgi:hypothetical protein
MSERLEWWEADGEAPVPLGAETAVAEEEPVDLVAGTVVEEAEDFLNEVTPVSLVEPDRGPHVSEDEEQGMPTARLPVAILLLVGCLLAFGHGWHVGSTRMAGKPSVGLGVVRVTHQDPVTR